MYLLDRLYVIRSEFVLLYQLVAVVGSSFGNDEQKARECFPHLFHCRTFDRLSQSGLTRLTRLTHRSQLFRVELG